MEEFNSRTGPIRTECNILGGVKPDRNSKIFEEINVSEDKSKICERLASRKCASIK